MVLVSGNQDASQPHRAAFYIDGFNLYHTIVEMNEPHLKWCNLWALSERLCSPSGLKVVRVAFCTAMPKEHRPASFARHQVYNAALELCGVEVIKGHFIYNDEIGRHSEKQSDINVALSLIVDGIDDLYDWAYLISADSDQAATARVFKERLSHKKLAIVAPPDRRPPNKAIPYADLHFTMKKEDIELSLMPNYVFGRSNPIRRPAEYDPPQGWLPPDQRPKRQR